MAQAMEFLKKQGFDKSSEKETKDKDDKPKK